MAAAFDKAELLSRVDNDMTFLAETVQMLSDDGPALIAGLRSAIQAGDAAAVGRHAHSLKGMLANFCAPEAQSAALSLEKLGKAGDLSGAPEALAVAEQRVVALTRELGEFVKAGA